ncbi:hypothetical protein ABVT39_004534 [Epinephelus coioides]
MSTKPKQVKKKSSVRLCPQGCSFSLHDKDQHEACPVCLGVLHARRALIEPGSCASCRQLRSSTLERRVTFVEKVLGKTTVSWQDPLLSESRDPASSESDGEELLAEVPAGDWVDQMEYVGSTPPLLRRLTRTTHPSSCCTAVQPRSWRWSGPLPHQLRNRCGLWDFSFPRADDC